MLVAVLQTYEEGELSADCVAALCQSLGLSAKWVWFGWYEENVSVEGRLHSASQLTLLLLLESSQAPCNRQPEWSTDCLFHLLLLLNDSRQVLCTCVQLCVLIYNA